MTSTICALIPKHTVYVEPFAGGAAVFFAKPWPKVTNIRQYVEVLNDVDGDIVNLYRCFQDLENRERLLERMRFTPCSREEYWLSQQPTTDPIEKACRTIVDIMTSFTNKKGAGWGTRVYNGNMGKNWANKVESLPNYFDRMVGVHIEHDDAFKVIERWDSPQTFFYCDPPYPDTTHKYHQDFSVHDFYRLVYTLNDCQGSFILSGYPQKNIVFPEDWTRVDKDVICSAKGRVGQDKSKKRDESAENRQRTEALWMRNSKPPRKEIQKLYDSGAYDCFKGFDHL